MKCLYGWQRVSARYCEREKGLEANPRGESTPDAHEKRVVAVLILRRRERRQHFSDIDGRAGRRTAKTQMML